MAELVYAYGSEPYGVILGGSNPLVPTVFFSGRSIPVVRILREDVDRVQFSTARHCDTLIKVIKLFLSVAGDRTHIGTYVGVSPPPASNENNFFIFRALLKILKHGYFFTKKFLVLAPSRSQVSKIFIMHFKINWQLSTVWMKKYCI